MFARVKMIVGKQSSCCALGVAWTCSQSATRNEQVRDNASLPTNIAAEQSKTVYCSIAPSQKSRRRLVAVCVNSVIVVRQPCLTRC